MMDMPIAATAQPIGGDSNYYYPPQPSMPPVETQQTPAKPPEKSRNLVADLIDTEKEYVENLKVLLQKVTACWSPDNLPPQQLDTIFRCMEAIYKLNKRFSIKLSKIGTNPQAAQNLADLLMSWIDEMEGPYTRFCQSFMRGFDSWPAIIEHTSLQETLAAISSARNEQVSLEYYFEMPFARLHYYKKLYMKLFKTTDPASDVCQLLQIANDRLDALISLEYQAKAPEIPNFDETLNNNNPTYASELSDHTQMLEHVNNYPRTAWNFGLTELEQQLDVTKVRDLFNKEPKKVKVALQPSSLPFQREIVMHDDFITIVRYADGDIMHRAHLFLLTDLLLICRIYNAEDRIQNPNMEFWLLYPPLSGRHLVVRDMKDSTDDIIEVTVMKKEKLYFRAESKEVKDEWLKEFERVITFSATADVKPQVKTNAPSLRKFQSTPQLRTPISPSDVVNSGSPVSPVMGLPRSPVNGSPVSPAMGMGLPRSPVNGSSSPVMGLPRSPVNESPVSPVMGLPRSPVNGSPVSPVMGLPRSPVNGSAGPERELPTSPMNRLSASLNKGLPSRPSPGLPNLRRSLTNGAPRSRTPEPPRSAGEHYPGGLNPYPSEQGRYSDSDLSRNTGFAADVASSAYNPLKRSNSLTSLASVSTIATVKETLYQTPPCEVFIWKNGEWTPLTRKERCLVEVRLSTQNKGCWAIILERSGRMVLNAWVHPTTSIHRESPTDVSIACELVSRQEYYRVNCLSQAEADKFQQSLQKIKYLKPELPTPLPSVMAPQIFVSRSSSLAGANGQTKDAEAVVTQVMEARCRLFLQNDHGVWTSLGWGNMKLLLEISSHRKRIIINSDKNKSKLIDSIVWEDGVEKVGKAGVAITLKRIESNVRIIYMMQMKDEKTAVKTIEVIKEKKLKS